jgi:membrane carboxypeptidase/penicillin-binding protein PbpC
VIIFDFAHDGQVNVVIRPRQPGSSIKPLTYALAFEQGKKPSDLLMIPYYLSNCW